MRKVAAAAMAALRLGANVLKAKVVAAAGWAGAIAGYLFDIAKEAVLTWIDAVLERFVRKGEIAENQEERRAIVEETQKLIDEKAAAGDELSGEQVAEIRRKKIKQEEELFNGKK